MAEKWTMHGKVTCDLCLDEQNIPEGTAKAIGRGSERPYLPGWMRVEVLRHPRRAYGSGGVNLDICELCRDVPNERALAVWNGAIDADLREELKRARRIGDWDNVRILAPALRGGPREEADRILARRNLWRWAEESSPADLMAAVPLHHADRLRALAAWGELAGRLVRAANKGEAPPVTAEWLIGAAEGTPLEESLMVKRTLRVLRRDYVQAGPER